MSLRIIITFLVLNAVITATVNYGQSHFINELEVRVQQLELGE